MRLTITLFFACLLSILSAQGQTSVNSGHGNASSSSGNVSYSIGEVFYRGASSSSGSIYPGVQQIYEIISDPVSTDPMPKVSLAVKVYPNPATDYIVLSFGGTDYTGYSARLINSSGQILQTVTIEKDETLIEVDKYPVGMYHLYLIKEQSIHKTFKIIKK